MTIYQRLLFYYITSAVNFIDQAEWFWELNNQLGICGAANVPFESKLYRQCKGRLQTERGYRLLLEDRLIQNYFSNIASEKALFAVIFSHWLQLDQSKIFHLQNSQNGASAWHTLIKYLITPEDIYYIRVGNKEETALKNGFNLITDDGTEYAIG